MDLKGLLKPRYEKEIATCGNCVYFRKTHWIFGNCEKYGNEDLIPCTIAFPCVNYINKKQYEQQKHLQEVKKYWKKVLKEINKKVKVICVRCGKEYQTTFGNTAFEDRIPVCDKCKTSKRKKDANLLKWSSEKRKKK